MSFNLKTHSLLLAGLLSVSGFAQAYECGVKSPQLVSLGDAYYDIGPTRDKHGRVIKSVPIDDRSNELLTALARDNFRHGSGVHYECFGTEKAPRVERSEFELSDISIYQRSEDFILRAIEEDHERRTLRPRRLFLSLLDHEIDIVSDNELSAYRKLRQFNKKTGFSFLRESFIEVTRDETGITLAQTIWMNGYLAGTTYWLLES